MATQNNVSPAKRKYLGSNARIALAKRHYADYVQYVHMGRWKEPDTLTSCEKLESIMEGKTKRLMIFMPPRHGKSMTVTETFPFYLGKNPEKRVIEISYSGDLAQQFGKRNRDKVEEFGPALFGHTISQVQATKTNWNLDNGMGGMISVGIGGSITGYGADLLIVDDPIKNRAEAESATYRDKLWDEYQSTVSTRLHAGGAVIIILTRWHEDDLAARLLNPEYGKVEDWDIISLPAVCEDPATDPLGRELGEALWPAGGYDEAWAAQQKETVGTYAWSLCICRPHTKLRRYVQAGMVEALGDNAVRPARFHPVVGLHLQGQGRLGLRCWTGLGKERRRPLSARSGAWPHELHGNAGCHARAFLQVAPDHQKAGRGQGQRYGGHRRAEERNPRIIPVEPFGGKVVRAHATTAVAEAGNVYIPAASACPWVMDFVEEMAAFPSGAHDDQVDCYSQANAYYNDNTFDIRSLIT